MGEGPEPPRPEEFEEEDLYVVGQELPDPEQVDDRTIGVAGLLTGVGGLMFGSGLLFGLPREFYGTGLALALLALAFGFHRFFTTAYPDIVAVEPRPEAQPDEDREPRGDLPKTRRRGFLGWVLGGGAALLGLSFLAPVTTLGPTPGDALRRTRWVSGTRLVTTDGDPIRPDDIESGSLVTAWPEDAVEHERSAVVVLRLLGPAAQPPTNLEWVLEGDLLAYSKICTHAGCPVGLFREADDSLFCPCHQATFDATRAAEPTFGPASRRLPQLPLGVDEDGHLVALGDFAEPIGPGYGWMPSGPRDAGGSAEGSS